MVTKGEIFFSSSSFFRGLDMMQTRFRHDDTPIFFVKENFKKKGNQTRIQVYTNLHLTA